MRDARREHRICSKKTLCANSPFPIPHSQKALSLWENFKTDLLPYHLCSLVVVGIIYRTINNNSFQDNIAKPTPTANKGLEVFIEPISQTVNSLDKIRRSPDCFELLSQTAQVNFYRFLPRWFFKRPQLV